MRILNLYAGIGGNRKLWGNDHEITAVEIDPNIASIYQYFFPEDRVIVGDAHKYLLEEFRRYDFIWASPPCTTHSTTRYMQKNRGLMYPDMSIYQEIILLENWFGGKYVVENVVPYYEPVIPYNYKLHRHVFWCNFRLEMKDYPKLKTGKMDKEREFLEDYFGFDLSKFEGVNKRTLLRNCVLPDLGKDIFDSLIFSVGGEQDKLWDRED